VIPERYAPYTYALFRIVVGMLFFFFGMQKLAGWFGGQAAPLMSLQSAAGLVETVCGFLIMVGLFTRPAALSIVIFMIFSIHFTSAKGFFWSNGGMEYSILILLVALVFMIRGGGEYSLDKSMAKEF